MKVLSLFDGMSTGQLALRNVGIKVDVYYASEIKPHAIQLTKHHFPDTVHLGDVTGWRDWDIDWSGIGLVLSGSPCQDLSAAGKRAGLNGSRSGLFWVFIEILEHVRKYNPNVLFLQENVGSASKRDVGIMSRALGVYPVRINSSLVTAQMRDRYYWTNIRTRPTMFDLVTDIPQPKDRGITLSQILEFGSTEKIKSYALVERYASANYYIDYTAQNAQRYYAKRAKRAMLTPIYDDNGLYRIFTQTEMERLQGFPDGYTSILPYKEAGSLLGDGWTLPVIEHIFSFITT